MNFNGIGVFLFILKHFSVFIIFTIDIYSVVTLGILKLLVSNKCFGNFYFKVAKAILSAVLGLTGFKLKPQPEETRRSHARTAPGNLPGPAVETVECFLPLIPFILKLYSLILSSCSLSSRALPFVAQRVVFARNAETWVQSLVGKFP